MRMWRVFTVDTLYRKLLEREKGFFFETQKSKTNRDCSFICCFGGCASRIQRKIRSRTGSEYLPKCEWKCNLLSTVMRTFLSLPQ